MDCEELASAILGRMDGDDDYDLDTLDIKLDEKWGIDFGTFASIANTLIRFTPTLESPLTKRPMHVFGRQRERDGAFIAYMRVPAD